MTTELEGSRLIMGGTQHEVRSLGVEPTEPGFPYSVEPFAIEGELGEVLDAAKIIIEPNGFTPPQRLLRKREGSLQQDYLLDFPLAGSGTLLLCRWDETKQKWEVEYHDFDDQNPNQKGLSIVYSAGTYLCWKAGSRGLTLVEACSPPFQLGDAATVDMNGEDVPPEFKEAFQNLTR
jgi:hypothetical protein